MKFAQETLQKSIDNLKDVVKTMITLVTGLFAVYWAIVKFLGVENVSGSNFDVVKDIVFLPPLFLILSLIALVVTIVPLVGQFSFAIPESIDRYRTRTMLIKHGCLLVATALLVTGLAYAIKVCTDLLNAL